MWARSRARLVVSGSFVGCDPMGGGGVDIKGPNHGHVFEQMLHDLLHCVELFALVTLGVLSRIPEAEGQHPIRFLV